MMLNIVSCVGESTEFKGGWRHSLGTDRNLAPLGGTVNSRNCSTVLPWSYCQSGFSCFSALCHCLWDVQSRDRYTDQLHVDHTSSSWLGEGRESDQWGDHMGFYSRIAGDLDLPSQQDDTQWQRGVPLWEMTLSPHEHYTALISKISLCAYKGYGRKQNQESPCRRRKKTQNKRVWWWS